MLRCLVLGFCVCDVCCVVCYEVMVWYAAVRVRVCVFGCVELCVGVFCRVGVR